MRHGVHCGGSLRAGGVADGASPTREEVRDDHGLAHHDQGARLGEGAPRHHWHRCMYGGERRMPRRREQLTRVLLVKDRLQLKRQLVTRRAQRD